MVWTDVFQSVIMLAGLLIVAVRGSLEVGGLSKVWEINKKHGRINFFEYVLHANIRFYRSIVKKYSRILIALPY